MLERERKSLFVSGLSPHTYVCVCVVWKECVCVFERQNEVCTHMHVCILLRRRRHRPLFTALQLQRSWERGISCVDYIYLRQCFEHNQTHYIGIYYVVYMDVSLSHDTYS